MRPTVRALAAAGATALVAGTLVGAALPAGAAATPAAPYAEAIRSIPYDFNGDGFVDLAIGAPQETIGTSGSEGGAGAVVVLYGSADGTTSADNDFWAQDSPDILDTSENGFVTGETFTHGDGFGSSTASGDFNQDGYADLAIGAPYESLDGMSAGAVNVLYGSATGLVAAGNQLLSQQGVAGEQERGDEFGRALTAGDFDGDGFADLAIGAPGESIGTVERAGAVTLVPGSANGLAPADRVVLSQASVGVADDPTQGDGFGSALAAGDVNSDGLADLAVGVPGETVNTRRAAGAVHLLLGARPAGSQFFTQATSGITGSPETSDTVGSALAMGDFNADGRDDLAVSAGLENLTSTGCNGSRCPQGAVHVLNGTASGLTAQGSLFLSQDTPGVPGTHEGGDGFGFSLAAGNLGGSAADDLAIGVPFETLGSTCCSHGAVITLPGSASGLTGSGSKMWTQSVAGVPGTPEPFDDFGWSVAIGNVGKSEHADLAVGVPHEALGRVKYTGMIHVLYGSSAGATTTGTQVWAQGSNGVRGTAEPNDFFGSSIGG